MNGRIYDGLLGRFLSADLIVQNPGSLQSFNRYSYCGNSPLSFTDPSGFEAETAEQKAEREAREAANRKSVETASLGETAQDRIAGNTTAGNAASNAGDRAQPASRPAAGKVAAAAPQTTLRDRITTGLTGNLEEKDWTSISDDSDSEGYSTWDKISNAGVGIAGVIQMAAGGLLISTGVGTPVGGYLLVNGACSTGAAISNGIDIWSGGKRSYQLNNSGFLGLTISLVQVGTGHFNSKFDLAASAGDLVLGVAVTGLPLQGRFGIPKVPNAYSSAVRLAVNRAELAYRIGPNIGSNLGNPVMQAFRGAEMASRFQPFSSLAADGTAAFSTYSTAKSMYDAFPVESSNTSPAPVVIYHSSAK